MRATAGHPRPLKAAKPDERTGGTLYPLEGVQSSTKWTDRSELLHRFAVAYPRRFGLNGFEPERAAGPWSPDTQPNGVRRPRAGRPHTLDLLRRERRRAAVRPTWSKRCAW